MSNNIYAVITGRWEIEYCIVLYNSKISLFDYYIDDYRVKWRPQRRDYLGSSALCIDFAVNVWDIRRPFVPFAAFNQHRDVTTDIAWRTSNPHIMISTSKGKLACSPGFWVG